jgi:hypothetical protein
VRLVSPEVSPQEAKRILSKRAKLSLRRKREWKKMELLYLPYYIHEVTVSQRNDEYKVVACTDGICSGFSFFDPEQMGFCEEASGVVLDFIVSPEEAERACLENLRLHLLHQGLRLKVRASIKGIHQVERTHYPYWVAYFKTARGYDFRAADAVTGEIQGVRMRKVFAAAFSQLSETGADDSKAPADDEGSDCQTDLPKPEPRPSQLSPDGR